MTDQPTEWVLTPENLYRLWTTIGHSKVHNRFDAGHVVPDGLTIWAHKSQPRTWARFGDTITRQPNGTWTVTHAEANA
ncbi:hypothetical protein [Streptomyces sp. LS1784]|uniref:hypothetical protein n=1 Tax=Streptomyces sp. LS1784 TaxID=2851533 RepID=UPI001CCC7A2D|nr:hypothetical protein [Streptomyces sp. LS1784]